MGRRQFTAEFKTKIVLEILREEKPIGDITAEHGISPNQLRNWKMEFLEKTAKVFSESKMEKELHAKEKALDEERNDLMAKFGQLTIENDRLKKNMDKSLDLTGKLSQVTKTINCLLPGSSSFLKSTEPASITRLSNWTESEKI